MKTAKISTLALVLIGITSVNAEAQSSKTNAWEGVNVQLSAGFASFSPKISGTSIAPTGALATYPKLLNQKVNVGTNASDLNTATSAVGVSYNFGLNQNYVLGVGANYYPGATPPGNASFTLSAPGGGPVPALNKTSPVSYQLKNLWSITLNPGYVIDKNKLVYAKVGYTGVTIGLNSETAPYQTTNLTGYSLGLGYKQMITESIYMLGEFNYGQFSNKAASLQSSNGTFSSTVAGSGYDFLVGVGYRF